MLTADDGGKTAKRKAGVGESSPQILGFSVVVPAKLFQLIFEVD
jgi:hypothetical protein